MPDLTVHVKLVARLYRLPQRLWLGPLEPAVGKSGRTADLTAVPASAAAQARNHKASISDLSCFVIGLPCYSFKNVLLLRVAELFLTR
jgi:hypothetical protein